MSSIFAELPSQRFTMTCSETISLRQFGRLFVALSSLDARLLGLVFYQSIRSTLNVDPTLRELALERPSHFLRTFDRYLTAEKQQARIVRIRFDSPGVVTVDASGALEKLIDILHSGKLQNAEREASSE